MLLTGRPFWIVLKILSQNNGLAVDSVGSPILARALAQMKYGGAVATVGLAVDKRYPIYYPGRIVLAWIR